MFPERRYLFKTGRIMKGGEKTDISDFGIKYAELYNNPIVEKSLIDHFNPKTAWENWIFLTYKCNLACSYCFEDKKSGKVKWNTDELINFLKWETEERNRKYYQENSKIMFYGGEPLLEQRLMKEIARKAEKLPFDFGIQTNGTLLAKIDGYILNKLKVISISIDGLRETHDKNRHFKSGKGSYDIIIDNLNEVKKRYDGRILARMTVPVTRDYNFLTEIKSIIDTGLFTDYHWQLETPICREASEKDLQTFIKNYKSSIKNVASFWIDNLKKGNIINLIPFETSVQKIIFEGLVKDLKDSDFYTIKKEAKSMCGCGDKLVVIDLDGKCYPCDTLVGVEDHVIGDIWNGADPRKFIEDNEFFVYGDFKGCPRRTIKNRSQIAYSKETKGCPIDSRYEPDFYCQIAGGFSSIIKDNMKDILNADVTYFFSPVSEFTEGLP